MELPAHSSGRRLILTVNGGSSSLKFALFETGGALRRIAGGKIDRIGLGQPTFEAHEGDGPPATPRPVAAANHEEAAAALTAWIEKRPGRERLSAVGHRVVHGGPSYAEHARIDDAMLAELRRLSPFDPNHLPEETLLAEAFHRRHPDVPQVACFDTAFHRDLPRVARLIPIPLRFEARGIRRYGFHGLSYASLMEELALVGGEAEAAGRVVLAHLGNGASLAAVRGGKSIDTSMAFTPAAGVPMSTRSGDLDPGLAWYLERVEGIDARAFNELVNARSGLLGLSETSSDMRDLLARQAHDRRAADAIAVFCYQVRKWIGAFAAALGGLDTLVFSGGIGENAPAVRSRICEGLGFLGIELDAARNQTGASLASTGAVKVRVLRTDEERTIARIVCRVLGLSPEDPDLHPGPSTGKEETHERHREPA